MSPTQGSSQVVPPDLTRDLTTTSKRATTHTPRRRTFPVLCVNPRCGTVRDGKREPRPTGGRSNLCERCEDHTRVNLNGIAASWPRLVDEVNAPPLRGDDPVRLSRSPGVSLNSAVEHIMIETERWLAWYARVVRDQRAVKYPQVQPSAVVTARWLGRSHLPWLAAHPDPRVSAGVVRDAASAVTSIEVVLRETKRRRISLPVRCQARVQDANDPEAPAVTCLALMFTWVDQDETLYDCECERGHRVPPSSWIRGTLRDAPMDRGAATALLRAIVSPVRHSSESGG